MSGLLAFLGASFDIPQSYPVHHDRLTSFSATDNQELFLILWSNSILHTDISECGIGRNHRISLQTVMSSLNANTDF